MPLDLRRIEIESLVRTLEYHPSIDSTSNRALELARQPQLLTPALVIADEQTAGRGRGENRWWSAVGGLTFSLVLDSESLYDDWLTAWPRFSLATALAVREALTDYVPHESIGIRWPNDVHIVGRKICGVLPELVAAENDRPARLVLGIGLNVNQSFDAAEGELRSVGISLFDLTGRMHDLTDLLLKILAELATKLSAAGRNDPQLARDWADCSLLTGHTVTVQQGSQRVRGQCEAIDADGALILNTGSQTHRLFGGTIAAVE